MKRYIYTSIGVIVCIVILVIVGLNMSSKKADDIPLPYNPTTSSTANPTTSPSKAPESPKATSTAIAEETPSGEPTAPIESPPAPIEEPAAEVLDENGNKLSNASIMKENPDGTIYFVDGKTGEKLDDEIAVVGEEPKKQAPAVGAGNDTDKSNAAQSYLKHVNALYEGNWTEACKYIQIPEGLSQADCESKLAKRTTEFPLATSYVIGDIKGISVNGDQAVLSQDSIKQTNGERIRPSILNRTSNPEVWKLGSQQLLEIQ